MRSRRVPQLRVGTGAGLRSDRHVNLKLRRPPHPSAAARSGPRPPAQACGPRLSHSAPRRAPPRPARPGHRREEPTGGGRARCCRCGPSSPIPRGARRSEGACLPHARTHGCARPVGSAAGAEDGGVAAGGGPAAPRWARAGAAPEPAASREPEPAPLGGRLAGLLPVVFLVPTPPGPSAVPRSVLQLPA